MSRFEYYKSGKQWRWRFKAGNGEIVANGEAYKNKRDCLRAISLLQTSIESPVVQVKAKIADPNQDECGP